MKKSMNSNRHRNMNRERREGRRVRALVLRIDVEALRFAC